MSRETCVSEESLVGNAVSGQISCVITTQVISMLCSCSVDMQLGSKSVVMTHEICLLIALSNETCFITARLMRPFANPCPSI